MQESRERVHLRPRSDSRVASFEGFMQPARPPNASTIRRRRDRNDGPADGAPGPAAEVAVAPAAATPPVAGAPEAERSPRRRVEVPVPVLDERPAATRSDARAEAESRPEDTLPARGATNFEEYKQIADLSADEVRAALEQYTRYAPSAKLRRGQRVQGKVSRISSSTVFVDVGTKADAILERNEVDGSVAVGDTIEAFVSSSPGEGEVRLTRTPSGEAAADMLVEAKEHRSVLLGKVTGQNEAGYTVALPGGLRGFCPASQIDVPPVTDPESYVGRNLGFRVLEVKGREAILTHRSVAEELAKVESARQLESLQPGDVYEGTVTRLADFGAFVRLANGVEGLVHVSEISRTRIQKPEEVLKEGQEVKVKVLRVDATTRRVGLSIKQVDREQGAIGDTRGVNLQQPKKESFGLMAGLLANWKPAEKAPKKEEAARRVVRK